MIDPSNVPQVASDERVAHFALQRSQFRADGAVKPDLFIPNTHGETSVMRHREATDDEIWNVGRTVASTRDRTLYGRADVEVVVCNRFALQVISTPLPVNPNHADIIGWPAKQDQKAVAQKLAVVASKLIPPS